MNPEKVGRFIKNLRKKNNLTQKDLANKYNVTYQAVSKWENGINLPDITLIRQMSKDFNIDVEDLLDGELIKQSKNKKNKIIIIIITIILLISIVLLIINIFNNKDFSFKTISSLCSDFKVTGSLAYDKNKSSIYISNINYTGEKCDINYKKIECVLYEKINDNNQVISNCNDKENTTLDSFLNDVKLNVDNYEQKCKMYDNNLLYLEIYAYDSNNNKTTYEIPLNINDNCS